MNGTFAFGHDRFGPEQDYFATYQRLGGTRLTAGELHGIMARCTSALMERYNSPDYFDDFPTLVEAFADFGGAEEADLRHLEAVFAAHELGRVPVENAAFISSVAKTHWIGVLSNLCAHPGLWLPTSPDAQTFQHFKHLVFSSEGRSIKPSRALFEKALAAVPTGRRILFVGDSLERDIIPAKTLGLGTAWISQSGSKHDDADVVIERLTDLATLEDQPSGR